MHGEDSYVLDNNAVGMFEYESHLDGLTYEGSLVYTDNVGKLDSLISGGRAACVVYIQESTSEDGTDAEKSNVMLTFLIDSVKILSRKQQMIQYGINLVSMNTEKCLKNIKYSNYASEAEPCVGIFKKCIALTEQKIDENSFDGIRSDVEIKYATSLNDNLFSVKKYLFNRMYSYGQREESLKFVLYDYVTNAYRMLDLQCPQKCAVGTRTVFLSHQQSGNEGIQQEEGIDIGSRTEFSAVSQALAFCEKRLHRYDFSSNGFDVYVYQPTALNSMFNASPDSVNSKKSEFLLTEQDGNIVSYGMWWENGFDVYSDLIGYLQNNRAIVLEIAGAALCRPGYIINIEQDMIDDIEFEDSPERMDESLSRYSGFEGAWYVLSVHGYFDVQFRRFRQVLVLARSYMAGTEQ